MQSMAFTIKHQLKVQHSMDGLEERLRQLVAETCRHLPGSTERQKGLTQIVRVITNSGRLCRDNASYYEDALQQTWIYFCRNLCEVNTAANYEPNRSSVITWLNGYLKWRLLDYRIQEQQQQARQAQTTSEQEAEEPIDPIGNLPAPPDIPPILEITRQWAETNSERKLRHIYIQGHPEVTCQVLILRRLPPETSWETLAAEFGVSISTLRNFYQRQCMPRLREFGESEGYL